MVSLTTFLVGLILGLMLHTNWAAQVRAKAYATLHEKIETLIQP